jgi:RNA polymerase sigma factor (sigma-70 family)
VHIVRLEMRPDLPDDRDRIDADERAALWQGIADLPPRIRAAMVLHYYADLPVADVAAALGVSSNTVKSQLQSGLQRLRGVLADVPAALPEARHA